MLSKLGGAVMLKLFFSFTFLLSCTLLVQSQAKLEFHSSYEKNVIKNYLEGHISPFDLQLISDPSVSEASVASYASNFDRILNDLKVKQKNIKSDDRFLSWLFYKVHRKVLKSYRPYTTVAETLSNGSYDCLSASTLYALLLKELGYDVNLIETTYHIYLTLEVEGKMIMLESTDPLYGFITNQAEIRQRLSEMESEVEFKTNTYQFKHNYESVVSLTKLTGLQYFNVAVEAYNSKHLIPTITYLEKASLFYHSERITEFGLVLASAIQNDDRIALETKAESINRISQFLKVTESVATR